jgi:hypothetical protein
VVDEFHFAGKRIAASTGAAEQPEALALGKFFREISEEVGEKLAFAALRMANARQMDPAFGLFRHG